MANWLAGLGQGLLGVSHGLEDISSTRLKEAEFALRQRAAKQQEELNQQALQKGGLELANIPKSEAQARAKAAIELFGVHAFDQPNVLKDLGTAGLNVPTQPLPDFLDSTKVGPSGPYDDSKQAFTTRQSISPVTGAQIPTSLLADEATKQQKLQQSQMLTGLMKNMGAGQNPGLKRNDAGSRLMLDMMGLDPNQVLGTMPKSPEEIAAEVEATRRAALPFQEQLQTFIAEHRREPIYLLSTTNPDTGLQTTTPATWHQAQQMANSGQSVIGRLTAEDSNRLSNIKTVQQILLPLKELSDKIHNEQGIVAKMKGGVEQIKAAANLNDDVAGYISFVTSIAGRLSRGAMGEVGVLTNQDIDRALSSVPKVGDSKSLADMKIKILMDLVGSQETAMMQRFGQASQAGVLMPGQIPRPGQPQQQPPMQPQVPQVPPSTNNVIRFREDANGNLVPN